MQAVRRSDAIPAPRTVVRTCVGCRRRDPQPDLLRVVAARLTSGPTPGWSVQPDPRRRLPGRGAYLHPDPECLQQATRRHAFGRALRQQGRPDLQALERLLGVAGQQH